MPEIVRGDCPGLDAAGCFIAADHADATGITHQRATVYTDGDRFTTLHEIGHAFDAAMMDDGERAAFEHALGWLDVVWISTYTDESGLLIARPDSISEEFADAYANCRLGHIVAPGHAWEVGYNYYPTAREHRRVCGIIARAGFDPA